MAQAQLESLLSALGSMEGVGIVFIIALAIIFLWEAVIVLSVLAAALSTQRRSRVRTPHL